VFSDKPVIDEFFSAPSQEIKIQAIENNPDDWDFVLTMWAVAGGIAVVGLAGFAFAFSRTGAEQRLKQFCLLGVGFGVISALSWLYVCYNRATLPAEEVAADQNIAWWAVGGFVFAMVIAVALVAFIVSQVYAKRTGLVVMGVTLVGAPVWLFLPLLAFLPVLIIGVVLLVVKASEVERGSELLAPSAAG